MKKHPPDGSLERARYLRRNQTDAERKMWTLLVECFPETRFRRQVRLRHFYADFASHRHRLIIEIDGGQHDEEADAGRTAILEAEGYRVIRFWNNEVMENGDGCMMRLDEILRHHHPHPSSASSSRSKLRYPSPIKGQEEA